MSSVRAITGSILLLFSLVAPSARAAEKVQYTVQPLAGFEIVEKEIPDLHSKIRFMYGARITGGYRQFAGEVEGTRATDREDFLLQSLSIEDRTDRVKLGIRSTQNLFGSSRLSITARAGGEASRTQHSQTLNGVSTQNTSPIYCRPYIGGGVSTEVYRGFALGFDVVAVINIHDLRKNDYQGTASIQIPVYSK